MRDGFLVRVLHTRSHHSLACAPQRLQRFRQEGVGPDEHKGKRVHGCIDPDRHREAGEPVLKDEPRAAARARVQQHGDSLDVSHSLRTAGEKQAKGTRRAVGNVY